MGANTPPPPPPPGVVVAGQPAAPAFIGPRHDDTFVGGAEAAPVRRPRRRVLAAMATLVVVAAAASAIVVASGGKSAEAAVIDSVNSTMADKTANISLHVNVHAPSAQVTATGTGQIDFSQSAMQLQMSVGVDAQQIQMNAVYIAGSVYEQIPGIDQVVPGKSWVSIDLSSLGAAGGQSASSLGTGNNPAAMLRILAQQGNTVVPLGSSSIDGTSVQGYLVTLNAATIKSRLQSAKLPSWMTGALSHVNIQDTTLKVYVDGAGLLRRFDVGLTESAASAGKVVVDESLDFSNYGTPVNVSAPPPDQVVSFEQFLQAAEAAAGGSST